MRQFIILLLFFISVSATGQNYHYALGESKISTSSSPADSINEKSYYNLSEKLITSAGVFNSDDVLVRTLWSNITKDKGTYEFPVWDNLMESNDGSLVNAPLGDYYIKVVSNNIKVTWNKNGIGNTSKFPSDTEPFRALARPFGIAATNDYLYVAVGYNEGMTSFYKVDLKEPTSFYPILGKGLKSRFVWTDGKNVYWGCDDPFQQNNVDHGPPVVSMVVVTKCSDDTEANLEKATPYTAIHGTRKHKSAINVVWDNNAKMYISGLSGQKNGDLLFVCRGNMNRISVLNKNTGELVNTINSISKPRHISVDGNSFFVVQKNNEVAKYTFDESGNIIHNDFIIETLSKPYSTEVNGDLLVILDGGESQQIKYFSKLDGSLKEKFGEEGGYFKSPKVTNEKFYFSDSMGYSDLELKSDASMFFNGTDIAYLPNGDFWVIDSGNSRIQHYDENKIFQNRIAYLPSFRNTYFDRNNPSRIFALYMEYDFNYENKSWELINNWGAKIPNGQDDFNARFRTVFSIQNRRYSVIHVKNKDGRFMSEIVELTENGIRKTGKITSEEGVTTSNGWNFYSDGMYAQSVYPKIGEKAKWFFKPFIGLDAYNNPLYGPVEVIAETPPITKYDPIHWADNTNSLRPKEVLDNGTRLSFNANKILTNLPEKMKLGFGYHLGFLDPVTNTWKAKTAFATSIDYKGDYPNDGGFDIGNDVWYAGSFAVALGDVALWGYHGEGWKNGQTNKWQIVNQDGLFLKYFGIASKGGTTGLREGSAGNAFSGNGIRYDDDTIYLFHCDESHYGRIHLWEITGLKTIKEYRKTLKINLTFF